MVLGQVSVVLGVVFVDYFSHRLFLSRVCYLRIPSSWKGSKSSGRPLGFISTAAGIYRSSVCRVMTDHLLRMGFQNVGLNCNR